MTGSRTSPDPITVPTQSRLVMGEQRCRPDRAAAPGRRPPDMGLCYLPHHLRQRRRLGRVSPALALPNGGHVRLLQRPGHSRKIHPHRARRPVGLRRRRYGYDSPALPTVVVDGVSDRAAAGRRRRKREQCRQGRDRPISTLPLRRADGCGGVALGCPRRTRSAGARYDEERLGQVD